MNLAKKEAEFYGNKGTGRSVALYIFIAFIICGLFVFPQRAESGPYSGECPRPVAEKGYTFTVMAEGLPRVDNLTRAGNGSIYATLELKKGQGKVVRISPDGHGEVILRGLNKPDGIRAAYGKLFIVEESKKGRVLEYDIKKKSLRTLKKIGYLEGLIIISKDELLLTRDRKKGKLLKLSLYGWVRVLAKRLKRPEGIVLGKKGEVFIAETSTGRILKYSGGKITTVVGGLNEPDQLAMSADGALLITEDQAPGRLLSYAKGRLSTIARCLSSPQGILPVEGGILVSEQGRGRVLKFTRRSAVGP